MRNPGTMDVHNTSTTILVGQEIPCLHWRVAVSGKPVGKDLAAVLVAYGGAERTGCLCIAVLIIEGRLVIRLRGQAPGCPEGCTV